MFTVETPAIAREARRRAARLIATLGAVLTGTLKGGILLSTLFVTLFGSLAAGSAAAEPPQLMVVFDGSGSIWGKLDGGPRSKLVLMREELSKALRATLPDAAVGLTTFGASAGNSCQSARTLLVPAAGQFDAFDQLLEKFNPQGRGPIVLGLTTAVEALKQVPGPVRILLIHDSPDNCGQDICAFADGVAKSDPRIAVDVISIAPKEDDAGAMGCLSKATGGQLIEAADTDAAIAGLNRIVLAMRGVAPRRPSAVAAPPPAVAKPAAAPLVAGLDLTARLAGSQTPIPSGLTWRIESTTNPAAPVSHTSTAVAPQLALPPGDYRVTLETATKRFEKTAAVVAGTRTPIVFELDGGTIDVRVGDGASGAPAPDTIVTVARRDGPGAGGAVWAGPASAAQALIVAAGSYIVTAGNGLLQRSVQVDVAAGAARQAVLGERPSRLIVSATGLDARTLSEMTISIAVDDTTAPGGRRTIARSTAAKAEFFLKPGPYHVTLSALDTENRGVVVLGAGQTATLALPLQKMALSVTTHVGTGDKLDGGDLRYRLWRADQLERPIAVSGVAQPVFHLVPGKYRIESRIDLQNAVMIREFDVGPGALGSLELRHRAGRVDFAFPAGGGGEAGAEIGTYWEIVDEQGQLIWRAFGQARNVTLAAGAYQVSAEYKDQRYSAKFTVVAGRREAVDLVKN